MFLHLTTTTTNSHKSRPARSLSLRLPTTRKEAVAAATTPPIAKAKRGRRWRNRTYTQRRAVVVVLAVCSAVLTYLVLTQSRRLEPFADVPYEEAPPPRIRIPPLPVDEGIHAIAQWEQDLPGNVISKEDEHEGRYLTFLNENWGVGFNNQLQEIILHAHLAYLSNRTFVLPPLNFPRSDRWYPLGAFVRGSLAGSPYPPPPAPQKTSKLQFPLLNSRSLSHPPEKDEREPRADLRAVTRDHFHNVCPEWENTPPANYTALEEQHSPLLSSSVATQPFSPLEHQKQHPHSLKRPVQQYAGLSTTPLYALLGLEEEPSGDKILEGWTKVLSGMQERCVLIERTSEHVFDFRLFGSTRILPLLPSLLRSPVLRDLHWSTLVHAAAERNLKAWDWVKPPAPPQDQPQRTWLSRDDGADSESGRVKKEAEAREEESAAEEENPNTHEPIPRVLALHLRRGDYKEHCEYLSAWGSGYLGVNEQEGLPDRFTVPDHGNVTPEQRAAFARHCWPELPDILARVHAVRQDWQARVEHERGWFAKARAWLGRDKGWRLNRVYVLTNGERAWWEGVRGALREEGWEVRGSGDMDFVDGEGQVGERAEGERLVGQAIDMEMAARAEVFIGNGFSSLTSNVNLFRLAHGAPGASIRFW